MVVENLKVFTVKSYKEIFKMYKNNKLGFTEQRMPDDLKALKPSETLSELECIQSLLETDYDFPYHVYFDGKKYIITILGFSISKIIDAKKQLIQFGEDGIWQEEAEFKDRIDESELEWRDSSNNTLEMWGMSQVKKHNKINLKEFFKNRTLYIKNGYELEEFRNILSLKGLNIRMGYDESYKEDKEVSSGYMHREGNRFYLSKDDFFKNKTTFNAIFELTELNYDDVKQKTLTNN